jgi:negative regulator of sigma E activity
VSRLRLLLLVSGACALLTGGTVFACVAPGPEAETLPVPSRSANAMRLLEAAAVVARTRSWSGTQSIVSTRAGEPHFMMLTVHHTPVEGSRVASVVDDSEGIALDLIDDTLFSLLVSHYDVAVVGDTLCNGRRTVLVEARRPGVIGVGGVAGRFWIDELTGLVLRRDILDDGGAVVRSSAFVSLDVEATAPKATAAQVAEPAGEKLSDDEVRELVGEGWPLLDHLPSGMEVFDARMLREDGHDVVQMSYSDGLSTLSLFVQQGVLPANAKGGVRLVGGTLVRVSGTTPEQLVWSGGGHTWTLLSDAPESAVEEAVLVLPHADPPPEHDGMGGRVWRGMSRVGGWLNPFQ